MSETPQEWAKKDHWEVWVGWMKNQPTDWNRQLEQEVKEQNPTSGFTTEDKDYPGWWPQRGLSHPFENLCDNYEEALDVITKALKRPNLGEMAGLHFSKSQRKALIQEVHQRFGQPVLEKGSYHHAWFYGDWALKVSIEHVPFREIFDTTFAALNNPLRSLQGRRARVERLLDSAGKDEAELVAEGVLGIEGNTVRVGNWSQAFEDKDYVEGVAYPTYDAEHVFDGIMLYSEAAGATFYFYDLEEEPA
ncbi:hypothetical protein Mrose_00855 [Calidithermus roseus]|uniref:Uncharacterized protein n=2 Tax=Calidithermus roseus TaxID=1644118 RepID=A0A399EYH6_9DEIN|nr:hypothetical protein Mrose_00855 [Calidithermus roseus]